MYMYNYLNVLILMIQGNVTFSELGEYLVDEKPLGPLTMHQ